MFPVLFDWWWILFWRKSGKKKQWKIYFIYFVCNKEIEDENPSKTLLQFPKISPNDFKNNSNISNFNHKSDKFAAHLIIILWKRSKNVNQPIFRGKWKIATIYEEATFNNPQFTKKVLQTFCCEVKSFQIFTFFKFFF